MKQKRSLYLFILLLIVPLILSGCVVDKKSVTSSNGDMIPVNTEKNTPTDTTPVVSNIISTKRTYSGTQLAGISAPYLVFTEEDYKNALADNKIILLYFYSETCKVCIADQYTTLDAFNKIKRSDMIGFRIDYNDVNTDAFEKDLAAQFKVTGSHTKVILKNGLMVKKATSEWNEYDYYNQMVLYIDK